MYYEFYSVGIATWQTYQVLHYNKSLTCGSTWQAPADKVVVLIFDSLKVEYQESCTEDYITVENLSSVYGVRCVKYSTLRD